MLNKFIFFFISSLLVIRLLSATHHVEVYKVLSSESHHYQLQQYITSILIVIASHKLSLYLHNTVYQTYHQNVLYTMSKIGNTHNLSNNCNISILTEKNSHSFMFFNTTLFFNIERSQYHSLERLHQNHILYTFCSQLLFSVQRSSETPAIHYFGQKVQLQVLIQ